jgi:transketolase
MAVMAEKMRDQMVATLEDVLDRDERVMVLLGNITTDQLEGAARAHPERVLDLGILEQTIVSAAAGVALEGMIPVAHSITPFLVERPFEQIKDDFCYQRLGGSFISVGASYDYTTSGMTHHSPGDVQILRSLPGMQIVVPGTAGEFDQLFRETYANGSPTYFRLSVRSNAEERPVRFGQAEVVREGGRATVVAVGPMLERTLEAVADLDMTVLYYTTVAPFDGETLRAHAPHGDVLLVEPFYEGTLTPEVTAAMGRLPVRVGAIGVAHRVLDAYGTVEEHDAALGLDANGIRRRVEAYVREWSAVGDITAAQ